MNIKRATKPLLATVTLIGALSLTACNIDIKESGGASGSSASNAPADNGSGNGSGNGNGNGNGSNGGSGSGSGGSGGSNGGKSHAGGGKVGICRTANLTVTASDSTTDKETGVVTVGLKNKGGSDCSISGFAGVDLKTGDGDTISVDRNGDQVHPDILKNGESAAFNITFPYNNTGGSGVRIAKIMVTAPNDTSQAIVAWPAGSLPVDNPDAPNKGAKLTISPATKASNSPRG
ncbi:DUF4232 domain-containing protein [Streptomyces celluloflavus]|uniref:DUF4232 domain-containing protein n=1 Tax=Streptomyces celluloflavus TaxID=58344 RepID=UPI0036B24C48